MELEEKRRKKLIGKKYKTTRNKYVKNRREEESNFERIKIEKCKRTKTFQ